MKTLIIGSGQLGTAIRNHLIGAEPDLVITTRANLELSWTQNIKQFIADNGATIFTRVSSPPSVIYLTAAKTDVDTCESKHIVTDKVNVLAVKTIVDSLHPSTKLVYFSSDYVFDGITGMYRDTDIPNPINHYGRQKLLAEHYIATHCKRFCIIRTNLIFSQNGNNFCARVLDHLRKKVYIDVPVDEYVTPTFVQDLAKVSIDIGESKDPDDLNKLIHLAGPRLISRYQFARMIADKFDLDDHAIRPVLTKDLIRVAKRPLNGGLQITSKYSGSIRDPFDCIE